VVWVLDCIAWVVGLFDLRLVSLVIVLCISLIYGIFYCLICLLFG